MQNLQTIPEEVAVQIKGCFEKKLIRNGHNMSFETKF